MKWFLTGDSLGIRQALIDEGQEVVGSAGMYRPETDDEFEAMDYPIGQYVRSLGSFDVMLLDNVWRRPGYKKRTPLTWGGLVKGRCIVGVSLTDPESYRIARETWRGCNVRAAQLSVYVSTDMTSLNQFTSTGNKGVLWGNGISPLIDAVSDVCNYRARDRRIYS